MPKLLIKTFTGLEPVLARELEDLGADNVQQVSRGVICEGGTRLLYRANLELRTGLRVYYHLFDTDASSDYVLYQGVGDYDWSQHLQPEGTLYVTSTVVQTDWIDNSMIATLKTKDAIVDKLRVGERRPNVDRDRPDLARPYLRAPGQRLGVARLDGRSALQARLPTAVGDGAH